jgi:hypothetical protein
MNQEIFSPDDLDQFQFSPSDRNSERTQRTSTQPIAAYASSLSESLKSLSIVQEAKKAKTRKGIPNVTYYLSSSHSTLEEAQAVLAAEGGWRCKQGRNSAKGSKKFQKSIVFSLNYYFYIKTTLLLYQLLNS